MEQIHVIKLRVRDKHSKELNRQARAVNFVWNFCNETQQKAFRDRRMFLSKYDLQKLTAGASKELGLHAHTIQQVCWTYAKSRIQQKGAKSERRKKMSKVIKELPHEYDVERIVDVVCSRWPLYNSKYFPTPKEIEMDTCVREILRLRQELRKTELLVDKYRGGSGSSVG